MKIVCVHCGGLFTITAADLGGQGYCPHCRALVTLPKPQAPRPAWHPVRPRPRHWLEGSLSGVLSLLIHLTALLAIALWQHAYRGEGAGEGVEVQIGKLPVEELIARPEEQLSATEVVKQQALEGSLPGELELPDPAASSSPSAVGEMSAALVTAGSAAASVDLGPVRVGGASSAGGGSWEGLIGELRRSGLDIVLCFDSTGSMQGEIDQVKAQIERIGQALVQLIPKARLSVCTYRDRGDDYVAKGLPLTSSIQDVSSFLATIRASGGGDLPEAVDEGLAWSISRNQFRPTARKVILIFGDAPPHREYLDRCVALAADFRKQQGGIVSTVTCRSDAPLPEFYQIAAAGGGEAFLTTHEREIMTQLMVLVFGSRHRQKVIEAFKLLQR
jgi:hypothetical protein